MTREPIHTLPALSRAVLLLAVTLVLLGATLTAGCGDRIDVPTVNPERPAAAKEPTSTDLSTPEAAVRTYLDHVSYAYRLGRSDVASQAMGPVELGRVDAYVELDRQRRRLIDQHLKTIVFGRTVESGPDMRFVPASESWTYRYIDATTGAFKDVGREASFAATYTVERAPDGWLVTSVEATATTPLQ